MHNSNLQLASLSLVQESQALEANQARNQLAAYTFAAHLEMEKVNILSPIMVILEDLRSG